MQHLCFNKLPGQLRNTLLFVEPISSLLFQNKPATAPYPEPH